MTQPSIRYRLDEVEDLAQQAGFAVAHREPHRVDLRLRDGVVLTFENLETTADTLLGFQGTPWHAHGIVAFATSDGYYEEYDELEVVVGLACGDLVVITVSVDGVVTDRLLGHAKEPVDGTYLGPGERYCIERMRATPGPDGNPDGP